MEKNIEKILQIFFEGCQKLNLSFFVVGAAARDILFKKSGIRLKRATADIDFGVAIEKAEDVEKLKDYLLTHSFKKTKETYRLLYKNVPVDIIPFGDVVEEDKNVGWQKFDKDMLNVMGFEESWKMSERHNIGGKDIQVASIEGLVVLKMIAWNDRSENKHLEDLAQILKNIDSLNPERIENIFDEHLDILEKYDYDQNLASMHLVGAALKENLERKSLDRIQKILQNELDLNDSSVFLNGLNKYSFKNETVDETKEYLTALISGTK